MIALTDAEALSILDEIGAVLTGHFIGTSGRHLRGFVSKEVPTRYPQKLRILAQGIAHKCQDIPVDVVVALPMGAINLGGLVAEELGVEFVFLEEVFQVLGTTNEGFEILIRQGSLSVKRATFREAVEGRRVGMVEDIFTTGLTSRKGMVAVRNAGGYVKWVSGLFNRGGLDAPSIGAPIFRPLVSQFLDDWPSEACALCQAAVPVPINLSPGHGTQYKLLNPGYEGGYI